MRRDGRWRKDSKAEEKKQKIEKKESKKGTMKKL